MLTVSLTHKTNCLQDDIHIRIQLKSHLFINVDPGGGGGGSGALKQKWVTTLMPLFAQSFCLL